MNEREREKKKREEKSSSGKALELPTRPKTPCCKGGNLLYIISGPLARPATHGVAEDLCSRLSERFSSARHALSHLQRAVQESTGFVGQVFGPRGG